MDKGKVDDVFNYGTEGNASYIEFLLSLWWKVSLSN
jgi:hypothetical protein